MAFFHELDVAQGGSGGFAHGFRHFDQGFVQLALVFLREEVHGFPNVIVLPLDVNLPLLARAIVRIIGIFPKKTFQHLRPLLKKVKRQVASY